MECSTCIPAIYFIFVSRDGDKCYWPTKILYTSTLRELDHAIMQGKPKAS